MLYEYRRLYRCMSHVPGLATGDAGGVPLKRDRHALHTLRALTVTDQTERNLGTVLDQHITIDRPLENSSMYVCNVRCKL